MEDIATLQRSMAYRYILALGLIAALSGVAFCLMRSVIGTHDMSAEVINLSGRQRMLSQRMALLAERLHTGTKTTREIYRAQLGEAWMAFTRAHGQLTSSDGRSRAAAPSAAVRALYFTAPDSLDARIKTYASIISDLMNATGPKAQQQALVRLHAFDLDQLLVRLDRVVAQYQAEAEADVAVAQRIEALIFFLTLVLLAAEVRWIFQPLTRATKELFDHLTEAREVAVRATDAKSSFLATITHEIRTPMIGVQGISEFLLESELSDKQRDHVSTVKRMADALIVLVNDILDFSKIEAGKLTLEQNPFDLRAVLTDEQALFQNSAKMKGVELTFEIDESLETKRIGDSMRLGQVMTNLIGNAVKFTPKGGKVSVLIVPAPTDPKGSVLFSIKDTGVGIPHADQSRLFRRFAQASDATARNYGGSGLGLAISKQIVDLAGGEIGLNSVEHEGSVFWFKLPLPRVSAATIAAATEAAAGDSAAADGGAADAAAPGSDAGRKLVLVKPSIGGDDTASAAAAANPAEATWSGMRALLAEDNPVNTAIGAATLRKLGFAVITAADGAAALAALKQSPCDIVFMDCEMPVMDGFTATREIRRLDQLIGTHTPILAMTAHLAPEIKQRCLEAGMDGFFTKPLDVKAVAAELQRLLQAVPPANHSSAVNS